MAVPTGSVFANVPREKNAPAKEQCPTILPAMHLSSLALGRDLHNHDKDPPKEVHHFGVAAVAVTVFFFAFQ